MEVGILILKIYILFTVSVMMIYLVRHFWFTLNRLFFEQRIYYQDIIDSDLRSVTVLIPMHNEEKVARQILDMLAETEYPHDKLEIIPINDFSSDETHTILDEFASRYSLIKPLHRYEGKRGKPAALELTQPLNQHGAKTPMRCSERSYGGAQSLCNQRRLGFTDLFQ